MENLSRLNESQRNYLIMRQPHVRGLYYTLEFVLKKIKCNKKPGKNTGFKNLN
jgi:hypothetical protein